MAGKAGGVMKQSNKAKMAAWMGKGVISTTFTIWGHRVFGVTTAAGFLSWRAWRYLQLGSMLSAVYHTVGEAMPAVEDLQGFVEFTPELYR